LPASDHRLVRPAPPAGAASPARSRRRFLARHLGGAGGLWLLQAASLPVPAFGHHGFAGLYDFSRPMYLAGRLTHAYIGFPHARLTLDVPRNLQVPRDREWMRALEDAEARPTLTLLVASDRRGPVDVSLHGRLPRRLIVEPGLVRVGDPVEAVVYRRTTRDEYRHELHAVLLTLPDGRLLVSSIQMR
jgi:hypothetical protein